MENLSNSGVVPQYISLHIIEEFTDHFSDDRKIGHGTYGDVYKGVHNGEDVAVKMLRFIQGKDDQKQFEKEFENLVRLRHENITRLIAYSYEVKQKYVEIRDNPMVPRKNEEGSRSTWVLAAEIYRALCFEYLQNGSLRKHLYDEYVGLDWPTRYKIIKGTCEALKYLHEGMETPVLHLDLKPDNILLDKDMVPKLADFGLSKHYTEEKIQPLQSAEETKSQMSGPVGTRGYTPPEYIDEYEVTNKFDIFSLGVIMIEIMTGGNGCQKCYGIPLDKFIEQVHKNWRERLKATAAYAALDEECYQVKTCIRIALNCVDQDPHKRPNIGSIVQSLNETEIKIEKMVISLPHDEPISDPGPHANKMPAPTEALIQVKPQQLCYRHPLEPNKNLASSLELKNLTNDHVAYMFVVSGEVEYSSARAKGIISPSSTWEVVFNMKAQNMSVLQHKNKVILRSTIVNKDLNPDDITLEIFKPTGRIVDEVKLDVVMEAPAASQPPVQEEAGKQEPHQEIVDPFKMLDVQPLELRFHFQRNKLVPCSVQLSNIKDEHVAFRLIEKSGEWFSKKKGGESRCFVQPLQGILPPGSTHTLIVTRKKLQGQEQMRDYDLILQTCVLGYFDKDWLPFQDQYECEEFFTRVKEWGGLVHEVTMKTSQEKPPEILSMETTDDILCCLDTNPIKKWIITGYCSGYAHIENYETQMAVESIKASKTAVCAIKFIARKKYFVAGSMDGFLHVYDYGTKPSNKKKSWKACDRSITSLAIHPTEPYILSSAYGDPIKLWNWEEDWECIQTFMVHSDLVRQLVFNSTDANVFASASDDKTIKVWKLHSQYPEYILDGHSGEVTCLDYFSCGNYQYLISGSNDKTAKIWDLQKKICIQTLDAFVSSVTCASAHPNLPVLITGSEDGILHIWRSTDFSLERVLNIGSGGEVRGVGFLMGSGRVVIGQSGAISELSIDSMNDHEASVYVVDDEAQEETAPGAGDSTSEETGGRKVGDIVETIEHEAAQKAVYALPGELSFKILQRLHELCIRRDSISRELEMLERREKAINLSLQLLQLITGNFSDALKIGSDEFGEVYKGILRYGTVAVKKIFNSHTIDNQMFHQEVINMIRVKHQNVVQLLGYCSHTEERALDISGNMIMVEERERLLCFEYMSNGILEDRITDELRGLEWNTRYQIIKGICDGLHHLHLKEHIIHMGLKPANIYLDDSMVPKIGDFGLSRLDDQTHTISAGRIFSIYGAPEYMHQGEVSVKSDIYSLGVTILEIVTGSKEEPSISNVLKKWRNRWSKTAEHKPLWDKQVTNCLNLARICTRIDPRERPDISNIIHELKTTDSMDEEASGTTDEFQELGDMLGVDPLTMHLSVELNKPISCSVELTNSTDDYFAFRISANRAHRYDIHPSRDIVAPQSKSSVTITLHALEIAPHHSYRKDEFSVQSTKVDGSLTITDISEGLFNEMTGNEVNDVNLIIILDV